MLCFWGVGRPAESTGSTAISKSTTLGSFYHLPPYLKLYDVLKATHANYKVRTHLRFRFLTKLFLPNAGVANLIYLSGDAGPPQ